MKQPSDESPDRWESTRPVTTPPCIRHPVPDTPGEHCCTLCCTVVVVPEPLTSREELARPIPTMAEYNTPLDVEAMYDANLVAARASMERGQARASARPEAVVDKLTEDEHIDLLGASSPASWARACKRVKTAHGGGYPEDWQERALPIMRALGLDGMEAP